MHFFQVDVARWPIYWETYQLLKSTYFITLWNSGMSAIQGVSITMCGIQSTEKCQYVKV